MERKKNRTIWNFVDCLEGDKVVWIIVLLLFLISIVCMFSSTSSLLEDGLTRVDLAKRQFRMVLVGLGFVILLYNIKNIKFFRWLSKWGFVVSFFLLVLLLSKIDTSFVKSVEYNGARRILEIKGQQFHVFEAVKIMMVMYLSWAMDALKKGELPGNFKTIWKKLLFIYLPFVTVFLMIIPGSNSSAIFIALVMVSVILLGGIDWKDILILASAAVLTVSCCVGIYEISDHQKMKRIGTAVSRLFDKTDWEEIYLTSPDKVEREKALDKIRQPYSAMIAIHEGGFFGKGPGQSTQRYVVPDIAEDYMFSFIIEEYGLFGGIWVMILYLSLLARGVLIVKNCRKDLFAKLAVAGLVLLIVGQAFLHILVNVDLIPMTGQTLPLLSHGNFAFICFCLAMGIILSLSRIAARRLEREAQRANPLVQMHEVTSVKDDLDDLDRFDSGQDMQDMQDMQE